MSKKSFTVSLDEELVRKLRNRAKSDYLTVEELINQILWRSAKRMDSSLRQGRGRHATEFMKAFSRYKPMHDKEYFCQVCKKTHRFDSKVGGEHLKFRKEEKN